MIGFHWSRGDAYATVAQTRCGGMTMRKFHSLIGAALLAGAGVEIAAAQDIANVPRNRTLISQGWDFHNQVPSPNNFSPYAGVLLHQRNSLHYSVNEMLFYTNHNTNEIIPWQAESFAYSADFKEIALKLRDGVTWRDLYDEEPPQELDAFRRRTN